MTTQKKTDERSTGQDRYFLLELQTRGGYRRYILDTNYNDVTRRVQPGEQALHSLTFTL